MEGKDGGGGRGKKRTRTRTRTKSPETERAGWSSWKQAKELVGGARDFPGPGPSRFRGGLGGGDWVHGAPVLVCGLAGYLIVPGARLYKTPQRLHKAHK